MLSRAPGGPDVLRIGSDGKAAVVTATSGPLVRTAMAVNATHVFWVQGGAVVRAAKTGGDAAVVVKLPAGKIQRLAADDTSVYWTDTGFAIVLDAVMRVDKAVKASP